MEASSISSFIGISTSSSPSFRLTASLSARLEISQSDDAYNAHLLLPDTYLSLDKIQNLIELLESRRVRTLTDAMTVYETNEHHRRIESIEQQRLQATQQAAEEQRRAADAAEDRLRETKRMAAEQRSALQDQQRKLAQMSSKRETLVIKEASRSQEKRGSTITCFHCKMQVPSKATTCPYCRKVKDYLKRCNIPYIEHDVSNPENAIELLKLGGKAQIPFLANRDKNIYLYDSEHIIKYLEEEE